MTRRPAAYKSVTVTHLALGFEFSSPPAAGESLPPFPRRGPDARNEDEAENAARVPTVLLVEDNAPDVYVIGLVLKECGIPIHLVVASNGEEALRIIERAETSSAHLRPSMILLDWNLPKLSGAEVLTYARNREAWKETPIVVVTSTNSPSDVDAIHELGATAHFQKPTDLDAYLDLKRIVLEALPPAKS